MENGDDFDAIYLDFSKAFNKVEWNILLLKMKVFNINFFQWLETLSTKTGNTVRVQGHLSVWEWVLSGVSQGSVLGLLLLLILAFDISKEIKDTNLGSFVDDTRIWPSLNTILTAEHPQFVLVYNEAEENNIIFNKYKFELHGFDNNNMASQYITPKVNQVPIEPKDTVNDYYPNQWKICEAHHQLLRSTKRTLSSLFWKLSNPTSRLWLLIFGSQPLSHTNLLENIQRRFRKIVTCFQAYDNILEINISATACHIWLKTL